jgi:Tol biopolymer transport system component
VRGVQIALALTIAVLNRRDVAAQPAAHPAGSQSTTRLAAAPTVVGPGVISTPAEEFKATVSPDDATLLYVVADHQFRHMTIVESHRSGSDWATPEVATFSGVWRDGDPSFAPDGKQLVFISNRPYPNDLTQAPRHNFNIWHVSRRADGTWTPPLPYGPPINTDSNVFAPSLTSTGVLYFNRGDVIFRAEPFGDTYRPPQPLSIHGSDPSISPDEKFIVFDATQDGQNHSNLFVSCRQPDGWTPPSRFSEPVSSEANDGDPSISPDGHWMFFYSQRYTPDPDRAPRTRRPSYAEVEQEAVTNIYNGSRNLYQVDLSSFSCDSTGR